MSPVVDVNLGLILRPVVSEVVLPAELAPGVMLLRVPEATLDTYRAVLLKNSFERYSSSGVRTPFEVTIEEPQLPKTRIEITALPESEHRYVGVLNSKDGQEAAILYYKTRNALRLVDDEIQLGITIRYNEGRIGSHCIGPDDRLALQQLVARNNTLILTAETVAQCQDLVTRMVELDEKAHPAIVRATQIFGDLDYVPIYSDLWALGHFIVWESFLTHDPHLNDSDDSLGNQLARAIPLLEHRLQAAGEPPIDVSWAGKDHSLRSIVKRLYRYRSSIVHGAPAWEDLKKQPLSGLRGPFDTHKWVRLLTKRLLRAALYEPELVDDLRASG